MKMSGEVFGKTVTCTELEEGMDRHGQARTDRECLCYSLRLMRTFALQHSAGFDNDNGSDIDPVLPTAH